MAIRLVYFKHWLAFKCLMAPLGHAFGQPTYIKAELDGVIKARYENQNLFFFPPGCLLFGFSPPNFLFLFLQILVYLPQILTYESYAAWQLSLTKGTDFKTLHRCHNMLLTIFLKYRNIFLLLSDFLSP